MKQTLWCCVDNHLEKPNYYLQSLQHRKKDSIAIISQYFKDWKAAENLGWKCIKVSVEIKPL